MLVKLGVRVVEDEAAEETAVADSEQLVTIAGAVRSTVRA